MALTDYIALLSLVIAVFQLGYMFGFNQKKK